MQEARDITLLLSPLADSGPGWGILDLPGTPSLATPSLQQPPLAPATRLEEAPRGCRVPGWGSPSWDPHTSPEELRAQGVSRPWLLRCPTDGLISGCPPAPGPSSPAWLAPCPAILRL